MKFEEMSRDELQQHIEELQRKIDGFKEANSDLAMQLLSRDAEVIKVRRELEERVASCIQRDDMVSKSTAHYESLVANIPGTVYRCANDAFWTMEFISLQVEELTGYPADDFINNNVRSFSTVIHPDDQIKVVNAVNEGVRNAKPYSIEYRIRHKNGNTVPVYERGAGVYADNGDLLWLDGVIFDFVNTQLVDRGLL